MVAKPNPMDTCDIILSYLKKSNLNFQLSESPFAATIEIKKSFIRNKDGSERLPVFEELPSSIKHENQILVALNSALKISLAEKESEKDTFSNIIKELEMKVKKLTAKQNDEQKFFPYSSSWPAFKSEAINYYNYEPDKAIMNHHFDNAEDHPHKVDNSWPLNISQQYPPILPRPNLESKKVIIPVPKPSYSPTPSGSSSYTPPGPPPGFGPAKTSPVSLPLPRCTAAFPSNTPPGTPPGFESANTSSPSPPPADCNSLAPDKVPGISYI